MIIDLICNTCVCYTIRVHPHEDVLSTEGWTPMAAVFVCMMDVFSCWLADKQLWVLAMWCSSTYKNSLAVQLKKQNKNNNNKKKTTCKTSYHFKPLNFWLRPNLTLSLDHVAAWDKATPSNKTWRQKNPDLFFMDRLCSQAAGWCLDSTNMHLKLISTSVIWLLKLNHLTK